MKVHLYTKLWNEEGMLPFFFRHYDPVVDRCIAYDDGSTDDTLELLAAHDRVEIRPFERTHPTSFAQAKHLRHILRAPRGTAMARRKVKGGPTGEFRMPAKHNRMPRLAVPKEFHKVSRHRFNRVRRRGVEHTPIQAETARFVTRDLGRDARSTAPLGSSALHLCR